MDLITNRTIEITKLGMDGLMDRQHAIASNIANVMTPDYQRKEVAFESQLSEIIEKEDLKDYIKGQNSIDYKPPIINTPNHIDQEVNFSSIVSNNQNLILKYIYTLIAKKVNNEHLKSNHCCSQ